MNINSQLEYSFKFDSLFSEYLPTSFSISPLNDFDIFSVQVKEKSDNIEPYFFTMSKFSSFDNRRLIYLPELTSYINLIKFMLDKKIIHELCDFSQNDTHSTSQIIHQDGEAISFITHEGSYDKIENSDSSLTVDNDDPSTYTSNIIDKLNRARGAKGILFLDVSNCYRSIYTHYLAAIHFGLDDAKRQYLTHKSDQTKSDERYKTYMKLDGFVRALNQNESHGLLIGPRVSNYLVEGFLSRIDIDIESELKNDPQLRYIDFVRYVDDYEFFVYDEKDIDKLVDLVERVFNRYRLTINDLKTQFFAFPYYISKNLKRLYDNHAIVTSLETEAIHEMFNDYFTLEKDGVKGAICYLIKSIQPSLSFEDGALYTTLLLNVLSNNNRSLVRVCQLMIRDRHKMLITDENLSFIERLLTKYIEKRMDLECIWLLYLLKKLGKKKLDDHVIEIILKSDNELAIIILIYEYNLPQATIERYADNWSSWILCYQLYLKEILSKEAFVAKTGINKNAAFYSQLKHNKFSFYRVETEDIIADCDVVDEEQSM